MSQSTSEVISKLEEAGAEVSEHTNGQFNIRKNGRLVVWYPNSKQHKAQDLDGQWHANIGLDTVLRWLERCDNAPRPEPKPAYSPPTQPQSRNGDAEKIIVLFAKRLEAIEQYLVARDSFTPAHPQIAPAQKAGRTQPSSTRKQNQSCPGYSTSPSMRSIQGRASLRRKL